MTYALWATWATRASPTPSPWRSKKPKGGRLALVQQQLNKAHNNVRAIGERGNSLMTFKAPRNISLDPLRIGNIVAAALVILHVDHARTT